LANSGTDGFKVKRKVTRKGGVNDGKSGSQELRREEVKRKVEGAKARQEQDLGYKIVPTKGGLGLQKWNDRLKTQEKCQVKGGMGKEKVNGRKGQRSEKPPIQGN